MITGRSAEKGEQALDEMHAGDAVHFVAGDVKERAECERGDRRDGRALRPHRHPRPQRRAASGDQAPVVDLTDEAMQDALLWNFWHAFWTMRKAFSLHDPPAVRSGHADVSSLEGKVGKPGISIYVVAKHAINGLTKSAAHEVGTIGITVNALCPGGIETDTMKELGPAAAESMGLDLPGPARRVRAGVGDQAPQRGRGRRRWSPCCSPPMPAAGITGSLISIDGGTAPY